MAAVIRQPFHWISIRPVTVILLVVEGYTFERKHFSLFVRCCNDILYGSLAVTHLVLLLLKSVLLEEFARRPLAILLIICSGRLRPSLQKRS